MDPNSIIALPAEEPTGLPLKKYSSKKKWLIISASMLVFVIIVALIGAVVWFKGQLAAVDTNNTHKELIKVEKGETITSVAATLKKNGLIRNEWVFRTYVRSQKLVVHAGAYMIAPSVDTPEIAKKIGKGKSDTFDLSISPGLSIDEIKKALKKSGFDDTSINAAFSTTYDIAILKSKPAGASLEGYVMGYARKFSADATPRDIIKEAIMQLGSYIQEKELEKAFKAQHLTLYQGIILASIVQKEVADPADMPHVAQVFYSRLHQDMPLGSDVTFIYGARLLGVPPSTDLDSPYNTRIHKGLPPTPIANPGKEALYAAAHPAKTKDLFFVAGDDGKTYFSKTNEEHERLVAEHCHVNCELPQD